MNTLELPPWLSSITPKKKKQEISVDIFDFQQLGKPKPRAAKKAKTVSRVVVDSNKMKYVELANPLAEKSLEEMQLLDYRLTRVELGKQTHAEIMHDAHDSVASLV